MAFPDIVAFFKEITRNFEDFDEKATAARELEKLKQGSRAFDRYYADFARLTASLNHTRESKMQTMERGIANDTQNPMAYQDTPDKETLESYIGCLKRMYEGLRQIRGQPKGPPIAPQNPRISVMPTTATETHPGPMDLSATQRTVSPEDRGRRIAEGLYFYCAG